MKPAAQPTKRGRRAEPVSPPGPDFAAERLAALRQLVPEAFTEGKVDFDELRTALGGDVDERPERYSFTWAGKRQAILELQKPTWGTLVPVRKDSVNFDTTQNLFIEGENLEVLKLLYKSYFGRVKLIYIDPPYNTGNDFVYPDDFTDPKEAYLRVTGQKDAEGNLLTSNPESSGRYHSAWLSMMYPRLFLARQLLRDDGVIFVSIDDHEVHNLRLLMNEVFGEENFIAQLVWEKGRKNDAKLFSVGHEYMVVYVRSLATLRELETVWREPKPGAKEIMQQCKTLHAQFGTNYPAIQKALQQWYQQLPVNHPSKRLARYKHVDKYSQKFGPWRDHDISWPGGGGPRYPVIHPKTKEPCRVPEDGWRYPSPDEMARRIRLELVEFRDDHSDPPMSKAHLIPIPDELDDETVQELVLQEEAEENEVAMQVMPSYIYKQAQVAVKYLKQLLGGKLFENPKDHEVIGRILRYCSPPTGQNIILDFFAGSATTAEAVLRANAEDEGDRRFICVQLPETTRKQASNGKIKESAAWKAGYSTIAELAKERIRRSAAKISQSPPGELPLNRGKDFGDLGFSVIKLVSSSFKPWPAADKSKPEEYVRTMELFADPLVDGWKPENVIYEVALREGFSLTARLEKLPGIKGNTVWRVTDADKGQSFRLCLDDELKPATMRALALAKDDLFICRDVALDDKLAANLALQCRLKTI